MTEPSAMSQAFCTLTDSSYLVRAVALIQSLQLHTANFTFWVLCCDDASFQVLSSMALANVTLVPLAQLEAADPDLASTRQNRSQIEYYFTCKVAWIRHLLHEPGVESVTYVDADIIFFSDPRELFERYAGASVLLIPHRFPPAMKTWEAFGRFNAGFVMFRKTPDGLACAEWWRARTLEWCYDYVDADRFTDQKYLDQCAELFDGVHTIDDVAAGSGTWNVAAYNVAKRENSLTINDRRVAFFHYHGFRIFGRRLLDAGGRMSANQKRILLGEYLRALAQAKLLVDTEAADPATFPLATNRRYVINPRTFLYLLMQRRLCILNSQERAQIVVGA